MATEFQQRKLGRVFDSFDADQDGVIDELDLIAMAQIWCDTYEMPPRSEEWRKIHGSARAMWRHLRGAMEVGGDQPVTRQEWVALLDEPGYEEFVKTAAIPFSMAVFDVADSDRDGRVSLPEMLAAQSKTGMSEEDTNRVFEKLDLDRDGYVTDAEYAQAAREYYLSADPDAPGNVIAGRL